MWTPLHARAAEQHGVLLACQAAELGYTWDALNRMVKEEGWTRLFHGAYLAPGYADSPLTRARAIQMRWPSLVASHHLAALAHGFAIVGTPRLSFTATNKSRRNLPSARLYRWLLPETDVVEIDGVRVTSKLRTALDLVRLKDRDTAVIAVDSALHEALLTLGEIAERLERLVGEPGIRNAWKAFITLDPKSASPGESKTRLIMWDLKIYPQTQVLIVGPDGAKYFADFVVEGVVFEQEGFAYHGHEEAHEDDVRRFNALAIAARSSGYDFCRITFKDAFARKVATGNTIVNTILARRRRLGRNGPTIGR